MTSNRNLDFWLREELEEFLGAVEPPQKTMEFYDVLALLHGGAPISTLDAEKAKKLQAFYKANKPIVHQFYALWTENQTARGRPDVTFEQMLIQYYRVEASIGLLKQPRGRTHAKMRN